MILYQQIFKSTPEVEAYNLYCIHKNLLNRNFNKIVLFIEKGYEISLSSNKIEFVEFNDRISYKDWFFISKNNDEIKILANSDIYFDESINYLKKINWNNTLVILSRKDLTKEGKIVDSEVFYKSSKKINPLCSQDAWAYKDNLGYFYCDYKLGYWNCESQLRNSAKKSGLNVKNLSEKINAIHVDWRTKNQKNNKPFYSNKTFYFLSVLLLLLHNFYS